MRINEITLIIKEPFEHIMRFLYNPGRSFSMKKTLKLIAALLLLPATLFAADAYYDTGSQIFNITAGATVPFFYSNPSNTDEPITMWPGDGEGNMHRTAGGVGAISYQVFVHPYIALGAELAFQFDFTRADIVQTNVPIFVKATAVPVQGRFEVPISIGAGLLYMSYDGASKLSFGCQFEVGIRYFITEAWGIGLNYGFYFFPEIYAGEPEKSSTMSYMPITLTVSYRH